jgi:hypothetical protein
MNTNMNKPIAVIANDHLLEVERLRDENTKLTKENKRLKDALKHTQANDYADDLCNDCEDGGQVLRVLRGK